MTKLEIALSLAAQGFHVFPLREGEKTPAIAEFPTKASRDTDTLRAWWSKNPEYNIGISTSRYADDKALLVVDVDNKDGKNGTGSVELLEMQGFEVPRTKAQSTPTGGGHLIYVVDAPVKQGVEVLGEGLDVRSKGGYIVAAGSITTKGEYTANNRELAPAPEWMIAKCGAPNVKTNTVVAAGNVTPDRAERDAIDILRRLPFAEAGSRNDDAFAAAVQLKDKGVLPDACFALMREHWRHEGHIDDYELNTVVRSAYSNSSNPIGATAPEALFPIEPETESSVDRYNKCYAYVAPLDRVIHETVDAEGKPCVHYLTTRAFHTANLSDSYLSGKSKVYRSVEWLESPNARRYNGVTFYPGLQDKLNGYYNQWRGFSVEPAGSGSSAATAALARWKEHLMQNVCGGNESHAKWLTGYFAHLVQRPWQKPLTAVVLRGGKGVGKNALLNPIASLAPTNITLAANRRYLIGNFNSHLEKSLAIILDEAFWSGDKAADGILKDLITGSHHQIERKGVDPYKVPNFTRVFILGNEDWLVPATGDERRFAVFDVGSGRKQDTAFFQSITDGMNEGGSAMLLKYLLDFNLSEVDVNVAPATDALTDQKMESLDLHAKWWSERLAEGAIGPNGVWPEQISADEIWDSFQQFTRNANVRNVIGGRIALGKSIRKMAPSTTKHRARQKLGGLHYVYTLLDLNVHRAEFEAYVGGSIKWEET